jgi:hypothetical protein
VPDQRAAQAQVRAGFAVIHGLPGQPGQLGGIDPHDHSQPLFPRRGDRGGRPVLAKDRSGTEQRLEQGLAQLDDGLPEGGGQRTRAGRGD